MTEVSECGFFFMLAGIRNFEAKANVRGFFVIMSGFGTKQMFNSLRRVDVTGFLLKGLLVSAATGLFCLSSCKVTPHQTSDESSLSPLPCRQSGKVPMLTFTRGETIMVPIRWNSNTTICEANVFKDNMETVIPIKRPAPCLEGIKDKAFNVTFPLDFPGCEAEEDRCVLQIYGQSDEPRTYSSCINFKLNPVNR